MKSARTIAVCVLGMLLPLQTACAKDPDPGPAATGPIKVGLITKFPVDFYDTMVDAVKQYDADHADVEVIYGQGKSGTDDEGEIAIIENMITQQVKAIAITPDQPERTGALDKAVKAGIKVVLIDNDIPGWTGKSSVVATDNLAGGKLAGKWLAEQLPAGSTDRRSCRAGSATRRSTTGSRASRRRSAARSTVVAEPATDCDQTKGLNAAQDILTAHPDVTAIYGACGPPIIGALQAIKAAGKKSGRLSWSASTPRRTSSPRSRPATRPPRSPSSRPRWAPWASRPPSRRPAARPCRPTSTPAPRW